MTSAAKDLPVWNPQSPFWFNVAQTVVFADAIEQSSKQQKHIHTTNNNQSSKPGGKKARQAKQVRQSKARQGKASKATQYKQGKASKATQSKQSKASKAIQAKQSKQGKASKGKASKAAQSKQSKQGKASKAARSKQSSAKQAKKSKASKAFQARQGKQSTAKQAKQSKPGNAKQANNQLGSLTPSAPLWSRCVLLPSHGPRPLNLYTRCGRITLSAHGHIHKARHCGWSFHEDPTGPRKRTSSEYRLDLPSNTSSGREVRLLAGVFDTSRQLLQFFDLPQSAEPTCENAAGAF